MTESDERFARDTTVEIVFDQRTLETLDRYAAGTGADRRTALHWAIIHAYSNEAQHQRDRPTWQWALPGVDEDDQAAARAAIEDGQPAAAWRTDPALAEATVAIWRLPSTYWAATVTTRPDPAEPEQWRCLLAGKFEHAAWLGGQAIAPLSYELAARARGPIWTIAEGDRVDRTDWEGYLDPDQLGETLATPPSQRPEPVDAEAFAAMLDAIEEAGKRAAGRGRRREAETNDAQLDEHEQWTQVIERRGGQHAATVIGADILRWLTACYEVGLTEADAEATGYDYRSGRRVGAAEARAKSARRAWIGPLLDLPKPY